MTAITDTTPKTLVIEIDTKLSKAALVKMLYTEHGIKDNKEVFDILTANKVNITKASVASAMWAIRTPEDSVGRSQTRGGSEYTVELERLIKEGNTNTECWTAMYKWATDQKKEPKNRKWVCDRAWAIRKKLDADGTKTDAKGQPMLPVKK